MSYPQVLIVDDEAAVRDSIAAVLNHLGFKVTACANGRQAAEAIGKSDYEVAVIDLNMPEMDGMETARQLKEIDPDLEIVILTGSATFESAMQAIHEQVFDYLCKPFDTAILSRSIARAGVRRRLILENREQRRQLELERNGLRKQVLAAKRALERQLAAGSVFIGESPQMAEVRRFVSEVAPDDITVLIRGESGTGKDAIARLIHDSSDRKLSGEFHKIKCLTLPETLLESELFGHEEGAFSGADRKKPGRFELADGGTIFLDEIGELPPALQAKLLQVIEHKQFLRVGGTKPINVDVRILAATSAPLETMIADGRFRADLYYRLNEYSIMLPPLRERPGDIAPLARHFLEKFRERNGSHVLILSAPILEVLSMHTWPGNVRELEALIRRFALTGREETILAALGDGAMAHAHPGRSGYFHSSTLHEMEVQTLLKALSDARWNQRRAAANLGISYSALRRRIAKHGLKDVK